jgi:uncharacterized protein YcbK (DUF882 family)
LGAAVIGLVAVPTGSQDAAAIGETRSLSFFHTHTNESATITYKRNGSFDPEGLKQLNWILRDWRVQEAAKMDPHLFDILWEVYRQVGSREPIHVISAYRSLQTNGMLRRASSGVAENSQHMQGRAIDIRLPDVDTARLRTAAMRLQYGGVGFYSSSAFVHVDTGSVRAWPRMTQDQLARLFPDGKTVHLPANGQPLPGYEQAKAEILPRNAALAAQATSGGSGGSLGTALASLFGRKSGDSTRSGEGRQVASALPNEAMAYAPADVSVQAAALVPMPPPRPGQRLPQAAYAVASLEPVATPAEAPAGLRPLFSPQPLDASAKKAAKVIVTPVKAVAVAEAPAVVDVSAPALLTGLSANPAADLGRARFQGPAVKPLPRFQVADARL